MFAITFERSRKNSYRFRQNDGFVVIDERKSFFSIAFDIMFGSAFVFPLYLIVGACLFKNGVLGVTAYSWSYYKQFPFWNWVILCLLLSIPFIFAYIGLSVLARAFARIYIKATNEFLFYGYTFFGFPIRLKEIPVSKITSIKLDWKYQSGGTVTHGFWVCIVSILPGEKVKPIDLFSCSNKESALELAKVLAGITKLPLQNVSPNHWWEEPDLNSIKNS